MLIAGILIAWFVLGYWGFIYWVTTQYDVGIGLALFGCLMAVIMGPITWVAGYIIHGDDPSSSRVVFKRRNTDSLVDIETVRWEQDKQS